MLRGIHFFILGLFVSVFVRAGEYDYLAPYWVKIPRLSRATLSESHIYLKEQLKIQNRFEVEVPSSAKSLDIELIWDSPISLRIKYYSEDNLLYEEVLFSRTAHPLDHREALWNYIGPATHLKVFKSGMVTIDPNRDTDAYRATLPFMLKLQPSLTSLEFLLPDAVALDQIRKRKQEKLDHGIRGQLGMVDRWEAFSRERTPHYPLQSVDYYYMNESEINLWGWIQRLTRIPQEVRLAVYWENQELRRTCAGTMLSKGTVFRSLDAILEDYL